MFRFLILFSALFAYGENRSAEDGGSSHELSVEKNRKNVKLLEEGLKKEPANSNYAFYLAENYRGCGEKGKALEWYQKRVDMGGADEEVFWSKLQIGHMLKALGLPTTIVIEGYKDAFSFRPYRVEPLYYLAELYNKQENYAKAYEILRVKDFLPKPEKKDIQFKEDWVADYGLLFQLSISAYYVGHYQEALSACDQLLAKVDLPETWRKLSEQNRTFPLAKLEAQEKETCSKY